ncbi:MAG: LCP family protein [Anaerolineales bacterium]|nr:LCP family protein [Anaerolineales bacterium]
MNEKSWLEDTQPIHRPDETLPTQPHDATPAPPERRRRGCGARILVVLATLVGLTFLSASLVGRLNVLILGIDRTPEGTVVGRSDSMILTTIIPVRGYSGMLSIPRDLWVSIPGVGDNRINTAHFFAEAAQAGSGPAAAADAVSRIFGVDVNYYVRFQFRSFQEIVDALGGIPLKLDQPAGGLPAGDYVLDGEAALAFVRYRAGSDDFFRMEHGQDFIRAFLSRALSPASWPRIPLVVSAVIRGVDTNLPIWTWPAIAWTLLVSGPEGIDTRVISRDMVQGFTTPDGAQVLAPNWMQINPILLEMFGQ